MDKQSKTYTLSANYQLKDGSCIACIKNAFPHSAVRHTNCYVFASQGHALIVDPGIDNDDMDDRLLELLLRLNIEPQNIRFFCTHLHIDHAQYCMRLVSLGATVYAFEKGKAFLQEARTLTYEQRVGDRYVYEGIPENIARSVAQEHASSVCLYDENDITWVQADESFSVGSFHFTIVDTRGHTPGCASLYESKTGVLVCGDFILGNHTPITNLPILTNPLHQYLASFAHADQYDITYVLPGHGDVAYEYIAARAREIQGRKKRLLSVLKKIADAKSNGLIGFLAMSSFCQSPLVNPSDAEELRSRWGSTANSISYLEFLTAEGLISRNERDGKALYTITDAGRRVLRENAV